MIYAGWDGGGTKTAVCILDETGEWITEADFGPLNPNGSDTAAVRDTVRAAVKFMANCRQESLDGCGGLAIGMAGFSNRDSVCFVQNALAEAGYHGRLHITGDQEIALNGAITGAGAVLIAGTGSVCCGRNADGEIYRTGGFGYLIDDPGSGYAIGRDIMTAVVRAADGRGPQTCLTGLLYHELEIEDTRGLIRWLYAPATNKRSVAALARLLQPACEQGDPAACAIAEKAADGLYELSAALWHHFDLRGGELALAGGILSHYPMVRAGVISRMRAQWPDIDIHDPLYPPSRGAAMMALSLF